MSIWNNVKIKVLRVPTLCVTLKMNEHTTFDCLSPVVHLWACTVYTVTNAVYTFTITISRVFPRFTEGGAQQSLKFHHQSHWPLFESTFPLWPQLFHFRCRKWFQRNQTVCDLESLEKSFPEIFCYKSCWYTWQNFKDQLRDPGEDFSARSKILILRLLRADKSTLRGNTKDSFNPNNCYSVLVPVKLW